MQDYANGVHELIAPDTLPVEVAHALTRAERKCDHSTPEGLEKFQQLAATFPQLHDYIPLLAPCFRHLLAEWIGVYDCLYVALAEREQCKVVTADTRMIGLFPNLTVSVDAL